jgi:hypothetical protein
MTRAAELAVVLKLRGMDAIAGQIADDLKIPFKTYGEEVRKKIRGVIQLL